MLFYLWNKCGLFVFYLNHPRSFNTVHFVISIFHAVLPFLVYCSVCAFTLLHSALICPFILWWHPVSKEISNIRFQLAFVSFTQCFMWMEEWLAPYLTKPKSSFGENCNLVSIINMYLVCILSELLVNELNLLAC